MGKTKYKLPLAVGFAALCDNIKAIRKTAEQSGSAVSTLAEATSNALDEVDDILMEKQDINPAVTFTIPTTGWGSDDTVPQFPNFYDVAVSNLLESDVVAVDVAPGSADAARAANFTTTQTYAGKFRLRAKNVPSKAIEEQYRIINTVKYTVQEQEGT